ncbi:MAG: CDP-alcohol phosphatidyltransferase family protein [Anaerolineales bacterium]|nr:CDP-alcohol phosphatidyltransferase family protein [Anaerolineales bacterium]
MLANWITLIRFPLLVVFLAILYGGAPSAIAWSVPYLFFLLALDTLDGVIARKRGEASLMGSILDIAADRTYELVLWVSFAGLGLLPIAIPLIVIIRTTLTDAIRTIGVGKGEAPFQQQRSRLSRFLVTAPIMRSGYSGTKILAFCGLTLAHGLSGYPPGSAASAAAGPVLTGSIWMAWVAAAICVLRGLPVISDAFRAYWNPAKAKKDTPAR